MSFCVLRFAFAQVPGPFVLAPSPQHEGSLVELETEVRVAQDWSYLNSHDAEVLLLKTDGVARLIYGLMKSLRAGTKSASAGRD